MAEPRTIRRSQSRATLLSAILTLSASLLSPGSTAAGLGEPQALHTRNYEIVTDAPQRDAEDLARHMDSVFDEYTKRLSAFGVRNTQPVRFYLWNTQNEYLDFLAQRGIDGSNSGGMFFVVDGEGALTTWIQGQDKQRLHHVLQHEGFHQFAYLRIGTTIPIWANEGLAEYFGEAVLVRGAMRIGLVPEGRLLVLQEKLRTNQYFPFQQLLTMTPEEWREHVRSGDKRAWLMYTQSWSVVHFLVHGAGGRYSDAFVKYLLLVSKGREPDAAFADAFDSTEMAPLERAWRDFVLKLEPDPLSASVERLEFLGEGLKFMHEQNVPVASIDDLKTKLRAVQFRVTRTEHGITRTISSDDDRLFLVPGGVNETAPPAGRKSPPSKSSGGNAKPALTLLPSKARDLPMGAEITGFGPTAVLAWERDPAGRPVSEIVFR